MKTFWAVFFGILAAAAAIGLLFLVVRVGSEIANAPSLSTMNQNSAVGSLRTISTAEITYASTYNTGWSKDLASLGPGCTPPAANCAGLIDEVLAGGKKSGYIFRYSPGAAGRRGRIDRYTITARPEAFGKSGTKSFFVDESGVIRETSEDREATTTDGPLGFIP
ncbi:MAG: hypothetical protein ABSA70_09280 [Terriglobia bacterium]